VEEYLCRLKQHDAYMLFINCLDYDGPLNTMIKPGTYDRFVLIDQPIKVPFLGIFKKRNYLKNYVGNYISILGNMGSIDGVTKWDMNNLFYVREDGLMLRNKGEYDNPDSFRDYLHRIDPTLRTELLESGLLKTSEELEMKAEKIKAAKPPYDFEQHIKDSIEIRKMFE